jgi:hypothetical protein
MRIVERIAQRVGRALERKGLLVPDCEHSFLATTHRYRAVVINFIGGGIDIPTVKSRASEYV